MILLSVAAAAPETTPDLGVPGEWLPCGVERTLVLRYEAVKGRNLPQAKWVKATVAAWTQAQSLGPVRLAVLSSLDEVEILRLLRAWDARSGAVGAAVTLSYPLALPVAARGENAEVDLRARLEWLSGKLLPWYNARLAALHGEAVLESAVDWARPVWKHGHLGGAPEWAPSRVGRCALETVGRTVSSQAERRQAFQTLRAAWCPEMEAALEAGAAYPAVLAARAAWEEGGSAVSATGLLLGMAEQVGADHRRRTGMRYCGSTWAEWAAFCDAPLPAPWATTYTELQGPAEMGRLLLTYAADDGGEHGQAARYRRRGETMECSLLLPTGPAAEAWAWCTFQLALPDVVQAELEDGGRLRAPDVRQRRDGTWVLDLKVEALPKGRCLGVPGRILSFDWGLDGGSRSRGSGARRPGARGARREEAEGLRKLLTAVVIQGATAEAPELEQVSRPFFLQVGGVYAKLKELRAHADRLRAKADRLRHEQRNRGGGTDPERRTRVELDAVWRRYEHLQDQLAHQASNFLLELAVESGCSVIAGEWLGNLKSSTKSKDLNWRINSQIRSKILAKLRYKAKRVGIRVAEVWPRGTSHRCPRCKADGQPVLDHPPHFEPRRKPGAHGWTAQQVGSKHRPRRCSWFCCRRCGFNGDRDYVAALNIGVEYGAEQEARRQQAEQRNRSGRRLAEAAAAHRQAVSYTGAAVAMPFTSRNAWFPILSGRHGQHRQTHSSRQWVRHGGGLCGWRGRHVRVTPYVCPHRLPSIA